MVWRIENIPPEFKPFIQPIKCASQSCGKVFKPNNVHQKYCSKRCKHRESKRKNKQSKRATNRNRIDLVFGTAIDYVKRENVNKPGTVPRYLAEEMLQIIGIHLPLVGERYWWEPVKQHARELCTVTSVKWDGEEFWIGSRSTQLATEPQVWNEWSRWIEATVLYDTPDDPEPNPSDTLQTFSITVKDSPVILRIVSE